MPWKAASTSLTQKGANDARQPLAHRPVHSGDRRGDANVCHLRGLSTMKTVMGSAYVTPEERRKIADIRSGYIADIIARTKRVGWCEITGLEHRLDDPPMHFLEEFALRVHEIETRGHDIAPLKTFESELKKECEANGLQVERDSKNFNYVVLTTAGEDKCLACNGRGRLVPSLPIPPDRYSYETLAQIVEAICPECHGTGGIKRLAGSPIL